VIDERASPAVGALAVIDGIAFETSGAQAFAGSVEVGQVSLLRATCA
jgi:hypothetical protein